ncbi:MAG: hypothetical protein J6R04_01215 [Clostridia bacterium]|nr:hypothetical protein [Clostridia bacterium]
MKRLSLIFLALALLCSAAIVPVAADSEASEFLSTGKIQDRVYEKPDVIPVEGAFSISNVTDRTIAVSLGKEVEKIDSDTGDEFLMFAGEAISGKAVAMVVDMRAKPLDLSDYEVGDLALRFQLYVSKPDAIKPHGEIELTSAGKSDYNEIHWSTDVTFQALKAGWNSIYLPLSSAGELRPPFDISSVNYFRTYFFLNEEMLIGIDHIEIVPIAEDLFCEDFESADASRKWESDHYLMTMENGALRLKCDPLVSDMGGTVAGFSDQQSVLSYSLTALEISLKADDPLALKSLSVALTDEEHRSARYQIDTAKISSEDYHTVIIPIQDMTAESDFTPDQVRSIGISISVYEETDLYIDRVQYKMYADTSWKDWLYDYEVTPGSYSIAVIPDIQELSMTYPDKLNTVMQWIADNREKENILFAADMGDVTWNGHLAVNPASAPKEFENARHGFDILKDAGVEFSISYGNHDFTPASGNTPRNTDMYNEYFPYEYFSDQASFGGSQESGRSDNMYYYVKAPKVNYLIVALEYSPDAETIAWANEVVASHPDHTVIVTVHDYLKGNGTRWDSGTKLWHELLKKHENILFLLCGHDWSTEYSGDLVMRKDKGDNGNTVYQVMTNAQDIDQSRKGVGTLLLLRFSEDGSIIDFNYFSPVSGYAFREVNQFKFAPTGEIRVIGAEEGQVFCGSPILSIESDETVYVTYGSNAIPVIDGQFRLPITNKRYNLTVSNAFGRLFHFPVTVNEGHVGGKATCDTLAACEHCGESYGDYAPHTYDDDGSCTLCGSSLSSEGDGEHQAPTQDPPTSEPASGQGLTLTLTICVGIVAAGAVVILLVLKKKK